MKRKWKAFLTAVVCICTSAATLPVSAYSPAGYTAHFVILATPPVAFLDASYVAYVGTTGFLQMKYFSVEQMDELFGSPENYPAAGDIVGVKCSDWSFASEDGITHANFSGVQNVDIIGSVYDEPTKQFFYSTENSLLDAEGKRYSYSVSFYHEGYQPPEGFYDLSQVKTGDQMIMAVDNYGRPIACVNLIPLGDVNTDSNFLYTPEVNIRYGTYYLD